MIIDGQDQNASGDVHCQTVNGKITIRIGIGNYSAVLDDADPPTVEDVVLASFSGGLQGLGYHKGKGSDTAEASKDGNTYKITGTASGFDISHPTSKVSKPFEIDATCP